MLTLLHPQAISDLRDLYAGLWPLYLPDGSLVLIAKFAKEAILAAKMKGSISLYVVPAPAASGYRCAGVITAFWDDHDEPLILTSPLFAEDPFTTDLVTLLSSEFFNVHLFDENNHELLGYRARNPAFEKFQALAKQLSFARFSRFLR